ncbi:MAG TPA: HlyD family efflux transporter periplasmic adaptor subunit [Thermoanaerobaculia bacterium]|nr:HlyD family efflux transporter periplasmic adaptor subunit [Thermoanaerobaculia bacterium]
METTKRDLAPTGQTAEPGTGPEGLRQIPALWVGPEPPPRRLRELLADRGLALSVAALPELADRVSANGVAIVCFGPGCSADEVQTALDQIAASEVPCLSVVLSGTSDLAGFQELVDDDRLFYLSRGSLSDRDLAGLIASAAETLLRRVNAAERQERSLPVETLRRLALARTLPELAEAVGAAILQATSAQRGRLLVFDPQRQALWNPTPEDAEAEPESGDSPAVGLASFILRTGLTLCLPRVGEDPRFDPDLDNPDGEPAERFLGVPVRGADGEVSAVLVAVRHAQEPPFEPREIAALESTAAHVAPYLTALAPAADLITHRGPFRERALRERELSAMPLEPLRLAPGWTRWTYWLMVGALAAALLALVVVRVPEYASGVAVVRAGGRVEVTATTGGTVASLAVAPQARVRKGQLLLTLSSAEEAANLRRLDREIESKLVQRLQAPSDPGIAQDLVALRSERELAQAQLAERELRAPADGEVSDIRVVDGQLVQAGQPVLAILARKELPSVVALLPGGSLPQLRPGMKLRLELPGHPYVYRWLELDSVAGEVIGPAEARRLLGPVAGDAVPLEGALAVVTALLPSPTFEVAGESYAYRDGMPSRAEVRIKSERLLFALLPALKSLWGENG